MNNQPQLAVHPSRFLSLVAIFLLAVALWSLIVFIVAAIVFSPVWMWITFTTMIVSSFMAHVLSDLAHED